MKYFNNYFIEVQTKDEAQWVPRIGRTDDADVHYKNQPVICSQKDAACCQELVWKKNLSRN